MTDMTPHYRLERATSENELLSMLETAWMKEVQDLGESEDYAQPQLEHARRIVGDGFPNYGIYVLHDGKEQYVGMLHANTARIPKTSGLTLRLNWILLSPLYDFEEVSEEEFARVSAGILFGAVRLAQTDEMKAHHVKVHLNNMGDKQFARGVAYTMFEHGSAAQVGVRGNWLHLDNVRPQGGGEHELRRVL